MHNGSTLFHALNGAPLPAWLERVLAVPNLGNEYLPWVLAAVAIAALFGGRRWRGTVVLGAIAVGITDPVCHHVIKELIAEPRPCAVLEGVQLRASRCPTSYSFPSSHAANVAAAVTVMAMRHPLTSPWAIGLVCLAGLARIRAGVHGPVDVLAGALIGAALAGAVVAAAGARVRLARTVASRLRGPEKRRWAAGALVLGGLLLAALALPQGPPPQRRAELELARLASGPPDQRVDASVWLRRNSEILPMGGVPILVAALADPEPAVRFAATVTLGHLREAPVEARDALARSLGDPVVGVRTQAAWTLGRLGRDATPALADLERLQSDGSPGTRQAARHAIARINAESVP